MKIVIGILVCFVFALSLLWE